MELDNLEADLQRVLRARAEVPARRDPVSDVHHGMRRRRRRQRLYVAATGLAVAAVAFGAVTVVGDHVGGPRAQTPASAGPTVPPTPVAVTEPATVTDVEITGQRGFALGAGTCGEAPCTVLLISDDGGQTWSRRTAQGLPACSDTGCPDRVRFADDKVGYAFGRGMWITTDSGRSWSRVSSGEVEALELSGQSAVRVLATATGCAPGCGYVVQTSAVGSLLWTTTFTQPSGSWVGAGLAARGDRVTALFYGHTAGGSSDARTAVARSSDAGATWTTGSDPCSPEPFTPTLESDTRDLALGPNGVAVALCIARRADGPAGVRVSTDGGRTYGSLLTVDTDSPGAVVVPAARSLVLQGFRDQQLELVATSDAGSSWTTVADQPAPTDAYGSRTPRTTLRFSSATEGTWLGTDGRSVHVTTDAGTTWTNYAFS